ncbi:MAG: hypothetical protein JSS03_08215 [Proteobacteria bacterium]|nr:hypothetical protein [Pseudomonadota bacterium]
MNDFLQRLRERKLVQWALAYIAAAFALIQVLDVIAQRFGWPDQLEKLLILTLVVGFFVTVVLAWYHGEKGAQRVTSTELVILALLLAIGGGLLWRFAHAPQSAPVATPAADAKAPTAAAIPAKSIAVLPFENLSEDKSNAYFAAGMQDEILTRLAGIHDLKVISRTSTEQYASHPPNLKIVAEQLGVATVLEGSVEKADGKVRINLQLIDARNDSHLWAQNYDRDLKDVFAVQSDVAEKVADALKAQLLPAESARIASVPTQNQEAYDLYLRALAFSNRATDQYGLTKAVMPQAIDLLQQSLAKDPNFALASALLGRSEMFLYFLGPDRTDARLTAAKNAAEQALAQQPELGEAHFALALYWYWGFRDYAHAQQELKLARKTLPHDFYVMEISAAIARRQGKWEQALEGQRQAQSFDPRNSSPAFELGQTYAMLRRYTEADQAYAHSAELSVDPALAQISRAENSVFWKGDLV